MRTFKILQLGLCILRDALKIGQDLPETANQIKIPLYFHIGPYENKLFRLFEQNCEAYMMTDTSQPHSLLELHKTQFASTLKLVSDEGEAKTSTQLRSVQTNRMKTILDVDKAFWLLSTNSLEMYIDSVVTFLQLLEMTVNNVISTLLTICFIRVITSY